ncbi:MAG: transcriptional regulator [Caldibacillus debilis]|jgi:CsoR family transcriptional regulator, copper-sensing transcriptional repressor|uniref:Transcriptional regulator n=1 Tax=Caldibacillus debilis TaxID=301148 RepID=A0A3E0JV51_9BACI|nr:metal-sensing transcriptional repressor [Caldibacillus debilis]MBO2481086.1 transcriptional regulator [Bacillaceae bacterium]MBY6274231.1 transcriptional regulator [Bacillaceae bacterium]OUM93086.1 MAG: transcriptional regulator [Caldibacillus debilis]REJ17427.1 MAG: transcriptional regulator [Caldibacillus debilis]REJ23922.1 MAG: transcriptional regulator [Caldibacillus debilis]
MTEYEDGKRKAKMVPRTGEEIENIVKRLKRIEGQVRGVQKMVEDNRYCIDILVQISAIQAALNKVGLNLLERHANHCVAKAIREGNGEESIRELMDVVKHFAK